MAKPKKEQPAQPVEINEPKEDGLITQVAGMLANMQSTLLKEIGDLGERVSDLESGKKTEILGVPNQTAQISTIARQQENVPTDILELVYKMISPKCRVRVEDSPSSPTFTVHVTIPQELTKVEGEDVRSKVIKYSESPEKVKEWLTLVKKNIWTEFNKAGESVPPQV